MYSKYTSRERWIHYSCQAHAISAAAHRRPRLPTPTAPPAFASLFTYLFIIKSYTKYTTDRQTMKSVKTLNTNTRQNIVYKITWKPCIGNDNTPSRTIIITLNNIVHLTTEHHFNITLVPLHTEHYILTNIRIATTILNTIVRNKLTISESWARHLCTKLSERMHNWSNKGRQQHNKGKR